MNHLISKTINPKETILFIYGNLSEVARQFAEMLKYCKKKKLHVVDIIVNYVDRLQRSFDDTFLFIMVFLFRC